jgi:CDP-archaeol synthase
LSRCACYPMPVPPFSPAHLTLWSEDAPADRFDVLTQMHPFLIAKLIVLLGIANGAPVLAKRLCGERFSQPIDGGLILFGGHRLFGPTKTIRGALVSIVLTTFGALALGFTPIIGLLLGAVAMVGDLSTSFVKRRLNFVPSSRFPGLDQIPESLFPLIACRGTLELSLLDIVVGVVAFVGGAMLLSPLFYRIGIRDQPF